MRDSDVIDLKSIKTTLKNDFQMPTYSKLHELVKTVKDRNPHKRGSKEYIMWREQCFINFPLLYLASIYLYIYAKKKGKLVNLAFDTHGSPIEMLNYDVRGTLRNYTMVRGTPTPIRDRPEYDLGLIESYHDCIKAFLHTMEPINLDDLDMYLVPDIK